jgi:hypothetical protein
MTPMQEHIEHWLSQGYGAEQIIRAAERLAEEAEHEIDKSEIGGEPLIRRYGR